MPVAICQPLSVVYLEQKLLTMPAMSDPNVKKSCNDPTKNPRRGAGVISASYLRQFQHRTPISIIACCVKLVLNGRNLRWNNVLDQTDGDIQ